MIPCDHHAHTDYDRNTLQKPNGKRNWPSITGERNEEKRNYRDENAENDDRNCSTISGWSSWLRVLLHI